MTLKDYLFAYKRVCVTKDSAYFAKFTICAG